MNYNGKRDRMKVLSINAGSSSMKFTAYEMPEAKDLISGYIERIGIEGSFYTLTYNGSLQGQTAYSILNEVDGEEGIVLQEITYVGNQKDAGTGYTVEAILPIGSNYCFNTIQTCNFEIQNLQNDSCMSPNLYL